MANVRGEVEFKGSGDAVYKLRLRTNELIDLASRFGCKTSELKATIDRKSQNGFGLDDARTILSVSLARNHEDFAKDDRKVGDLMDEIGEKAGPDKTTLQATLDLIGRMFAAGTEGPEGAPQPQAKPGDADPNA